MRKNLLLLSIGLMLLMVFPCPTGAMEVTGALNNDGLTLMKKTDLTTDHFYLRFSPWLSADLHANKVWGIKEAYGDWEFGPLSLSLGRKILTYGPGRNGHLILGPLGTGLTAEGYDQLAYHLQWRTFNYHKFYALVPETGKQALLGQRITYDFGPFTFGFTETALLNNRAPWFFYLPLPLIPVYAYQHLGISVSDTPNLNSTANILMAADLVWRPNPNCQVYLEYLADDQPGMEFKNGKLAFAAPDDNPWRIGCQGGIEWRRPFNLEALEFYADYTLIAQFTYTGLNQDLTYTYQDRLIGDPLGPDAERLNLELVYNPSPSRRWNFAFNRERHGEGELGDKWVHTEGQTLVFLTGIIETTTTVRIAATKFYPNYELTLAGGLSVVKNQDHQQGKTGYLPTFNLQTTWKNLRLVTQ